MIDKRYFLRCITRVFPTMFVSGAVRQVDGERSERVGRLERVGRMVEGERVERVGRLASLSIADMSPKLGKLINSQNTVEGRYIASLLG